MIRGHTLPPNRSSCLSCEMLLWCSAYLWDQTYGMILEIYYSKWSQASWPGITLGELPLADGEAKIPPFHEKRYTFTELLFPLSCLALDCVPCFLSDFIPWQFGMLNAPRPLILPVVILWQQWQSGENRKHRWDVQREKRNFSQQNRERLWAVQEEKPYLWVFTKTVKRRTVFSLWIRVVSGLMLCLCPCT